MKTIQPFKMKVTPEQSRIVQETIFENGGSWDDGDKNVHSVYGRFFTFKNKELTYWFDHIIYDIDVSPELTFNEFKNLYIDEKKEIAGYKLKEGCEKYMNAIFAIVNECTESRSLRYRAIWISEWSNVLNDYGFVFTKESETYNSLKEAGVLDIWFEPVYKK